LVIHDSLVSHRFYSRAIALPAAAQQNTSPDPVIRAIWNEGMDNSQLSTNGAGAARLGRAAIDRVTGMKAGNDWLVKTYASWGVRARKEQYGTG
jgi:carboxypeptidase Q